MLHSQECLNLKLEQFLLCSPHLPEAMLFLQSTPAFANYVVQQIFSFFKISFARLADYFECFSTSSLWAI